MVFNEHHTLFMAKCCKFCKWVFVHSECSFSLFSTSLLPPRTLSSPPCPEMDAGGGGHWTNSSITLTRLLGGNLTLVLCCAATILIPNLAFGQEWSSVSGSQRTLLTVSHVSHFLCLFICSLIQFLCTTEFTHIRTSLHVLFPKDKNRPRKEIQFGAGREIL